MKIDGNKIYEIELEDSTDPNLTEYAVGFYFVDEAEQLVGPYPTSEAAVAAIKAYADWLNNGPITDDEARLG